MAGETELRPELSVAELTRRVEEAQAVLLEHASWIVGMPFETPIRVHYIKYAHELNPRSLQLMVRLDEQRVLYINQDLTGGDTPWSVSATNLSAEREGVNFLNTGLSLYADGTAHSTQREMVEVEGESVGRCIGYDSDEIDDEAENASGVTNPRFASTIAELLEEAVREVPEHQRIFLEALSGTPEFRFANLMQRFRKPGFVPPGRTLDGASLEEELSAPDFPDWIHPDSFSSSVGR